MKHNKPNRIISTDDFVQQMYHATVTGRFSGKKPNVSNRPKYKKKKKFVTYWAETLREKMQRWVKSDISSVRLVELGVPLNMLTPIQRGTMMHHYLAQGNKIWSISTV